MTRFLVLALLTGAVFYTAPALAQQQTDPSVASMDCTRQYERAQRRYFDAAFTRAVALAEECLEHSDLAPDQRVRFLRLLVLSHLERGSIPQARQAAYDLLDLRPDYMPDPVEDPPAYAQFIREAKAERRRVANAENDGGPGWVTWALAGAGVVVTGVLAAVLFSGGGSNASPGSPTTPPR